MDKKRLEIVQVVERRRKWPAERSHGSWRKRWRRAPRLLALQTGMALPAARFMDGSGKRARASCLAYPLAPRPVPLSSRSRWQRPQPRRQPLVAARKAHASGNLYFPRRGATCRSLSLRPAHVSCHRAACALLGTVPHGAAPRTRTSYRALCSAACMQSLPQPLRRVAWRVPAVVTGAGNQLSRARCHFRNRGWRRLFRRGIHLRSARLPVQPADSPQKTPVKHTFACTFHACGCCPAILTGTASLPPRPGAGNAAKVAGYSGTGFTPKAILSNPSVRGPPAFLA